MTNTLSRRHLLRALGTVPLVALPLLAPGPVAAQTVYRCEGPNGPSYSQTPCPKGNKGKVLDVSDKRSAAERDQDRADAEEAARRAREQADRMTDERRADEIRNAGPSGPGALNTPRSPPEPEAAPPTQVETHRHRRIAPSPRPRPRPEPPPPPRKPIRLNTER